jgi:hypothetical protein
MLRAPPSFDARVVDSQNGKGWEVLWIVFASEFKDERRCFDCAAAWQKAGLAKVWKSVIVVLVPVS